MDDVNLSNLASMLWNLQFHAANSCVMKDMQMAAESCGNIEAARQFELEKAESAGTAAGLEFRILELFYDRNPIR